MDHADRVIALAERIDYLEKLLSRAYPWLHNPYHETSDYANAAEGDAVIEAVQTVIQHVPDEPDPKLNLKCASCDGAGCENCQPAPTDAQGRGDEDAAPVEHQSPPQRDCPARDHARWRDGDDH